jgi:hypothetical protein
MFRMTFATRNAAFEGLDYGPECARILREVADQMEVSTAEDEQESGIRDSNGNRIGKWITAP